MKAASHEESHLWALLVREMSQTRHPGQAMLLAVLSQATTKLLSINPQGGSGARPSSAKVTFSSKTLILFVREINSEFIEERLGLEQKAKSR